MGFARNLRDHADPMPYDVIEAEDVSTVIIAAGDELVVWSTSDVYWLRPEAVTIDDDNGSAYIDPIGPAVFNRRINWCRC